MQTAESGESQGVLEALARRLQGLNFLCVGYPLFAPSHLALLVLCIAATSAAEMDSATPAGNDERRAPV